MTVKYRYMNATKNEMKLGFRNENTNNYSDLYKLIAVRCLSVMKCSEVLIRGTHDYCWDGSAMMMALKTLAPTGLSPMART